MPTGSGGGIVAAVPGPIGGTTSNTGQFTKLAVGTSVPTLPTNAGDASILNSLGVGGAASGVASTLTLNSNGTITTNGGDLALQPNSNFIDAANNSIKRCQWIGVNVSTPVISNAMRMLAQTFASLPAAAAANAGTIAVVSDSTTIVWGATITGTGANTVLAFSDGTNWTVAAK